MERLQPWRPVGNDDFKGRGIHPAILAPCIARRIPAYSVLRFIGQPLSEAEPGALPALVGYAGCRAVNRSVRVGERLPRPLRGTYRPFALPMPALWARPHAGRGDLTEMPMSLRAAHRLVMIDLLRLSQIVTRELAVPVRWRTVARFRVLRPSAPQTRPNQRFSVPFPSVQMITPEPRRQTAYPPFPQQPSLWGHLDYSKPIGRLVVPGLVQ